MPSLRKSKSARHRRNHQLLDILTSEIPIIAFDAKAAASYGKLRANREKTGKLIGPNDMLITADALSLGLVLVTDNVRKFRRVKGLKVENWRK